MPPLPVSILYSLQIPTSKHFKTPVISNDLDPEYDQAFGAEAAFHSEVACSLRFTVCNTDPGVMPATPAEINQL